MLVSQKGGNNEATGRRPQAGLIVGFCFLDYSQQINRNLIRNAYKKTSFLMFVPDNVIDSRSLYPESTFVRSNPEKKNCKSFDSQARVI
jgi:hypothetical protein